jgi:hypothetical protein
MEPFPQEPFNSCTHFVFMTIIKISGMLFSNQLGLFAITSNRGNKYVVIFYIYDANFVKSVPIKSQSKEELLWAYRLVYTYLTAWGFKPQLHKMDKEMCHDVETFIPEENTRLHAYSTPHPTSTAPIWRYGKFALGKTTSSPALLGCCRPSQLQIGVGSRTKQTSPSTCYGHAVKILLYWRLRHSKGPTHLMQHQWLH